ncbi:MAG: hypothetical protein KC418_06215 [Anaerolineales bacterium]|nr:hypothetical protein [Anaerolineales bacterium]
MPPFIRFTHLDRQATEEETAHRLRMWGVGVGGRISTGILIWVRTYPKQRKWPHLTLEMVRPGVRYQVTLPSLSWRLLRSGDLLLPRSETMPRFCHRCRQLLNATDAFCPYCRAAQRPTGSPFWGFFLQNFWLIFLIVFALFVISNLLPLS